MSKKRSGFKTLKGKELLRLSLLHKLWLQTDGKEGVKLVVHLMTLKNLDLHFLELEKAVFWGCRFKNVSFGRKNLMLAHIKSCIFEPKKMEEKKQEVIVEPYSNPLPKSFRV